jgi:menaquinone-specific isochorismate synthase
MLTLEPQTSILNTFDRTAQTASFSAQLRQAIELARTDEKARYFSVTLKANIIDTLAFLEKVQNEKNFRYYWEKPDQQFSMIADGELEQIKGEGEGRFRKASREGKELLSRITHYTDVNHSKAVVHLLGGFSFYGDGDGEIWKSFDHASFTLPEWHILKEGKLSLVTVNVELHKSKVADDIIDSIREIFARLDEVNSLEEYVESDVEVSEYSIVDEQENEKRRWLEHIQTATRHIKAGLYKKIVLARKLHLKTDKRISDTCLLNKLRQQYPDCYLFLIGFNDEGSFIGATPERLATFRRNKIITEGLAGSISRGKTALEDAYLEHSLLNSDKDLNEHAFVVDAIEASLHPYSTRIEHPKTPGVKKLTNVQHLFTPVTAHIQDGVSRTEILKTLHPTPAVGGYPRDKAVPYIRELENFDRGWYAGPVGWINAAGEGEFAVAIRSGLIKKNEAHFFAGCGIVEHSDPQKEWDETNLKFIPLLSALKYAIQ